MAVLAYNYPMHFLTTSQVANELGITETTVRRYCNEGRMGTKIGRQWLITRDELDRFKKSRREPGRPKKQG